MVSPYYLSQAELRPRLGMIVPTWFPPDHAVDEAAAILATTLADLDTVVDPAHCLVVADGSAVAADAAARVGGGFTFVELDDGPHGKGGAVAHGLRRLLAEPAVEWLVVRDHDGDHFLNDVPRVVRLALQVRAEAANPAVLLNGGRTEPGRPMGWVRAEYERIVNAVVWRGLHYHAARRGAAVDERWLESHRPVPDLQSGLKCYSRAAAEWVVAASLAADWPMRRWGCEVLATVEVVARGGVFGEVQRAALDHQPLTTYEGDARRPRLHGDMLIWLAGRLELPAAAVRLWLDAAVAHSGLRTHGPGREELEALRAHVAEALEPGRAVPPQRAPWLG
ncbi:MAG: hypothetical protein HYU66_10880 [Armatimonadetes bacterium]|nr:hypothetical protein [Armatimonadota bacterium]